MKKKRILVVEDNQVIAMVLNYSLSHMSEQVEVVMSASAEEAERLFFTKEPYNLLIVGYHLPGKSGIDLIRKLKPSLGATLWIMISGTNSLELEQEIKQLGGYNYLVEPFSLADLRKVVWEALNLAQAEVSVS